MNPFFNLYMVVYITLAIFITYLLVRLLVSARTFFDAGTRYFNARVKDQDKEEQV